MEKASCGMVERALRGAPEELGHSIGPTVNSSNLLLFKKFFLNAFISF